MGLYTGARGKKERRVRKKNGWHGHYGLPASSPSDQYAREVGIDVNDPRSFFWIIRYQVLNKRMRKKGQPRRVAMVVRKDGIRSRYFALVFERKVRSEKDREESN